MEQVAEYACEDADITFQLAAALRPKIDDMDQQRVFYEIEAPLLPVLVDMEYEGIRMESAALDALSRQFEEAIEQAAERVFELAGERFNLNSGNQLGTILFEKMELDPNARRTQKTGQYQTSEQILRRLANRHEIARQVLDYRLHTKLKSTYVDQLPSAVFKATGRVHTNYEQLMTATGRMKSDRPNLQNIPIRSEQGRESAAPLCRAAATTGSSRPTIHRSSCGLPLRSAATRGVLGHLQQRRRHPHGYGRKDLPSRRRASDPRDAPSGQDGQLRHHLRDLTFWSWPSGSTFRAGRLLS